MNSCLTNIFLDDIEQQHISRSRSFLITSGALDNQMSFPVFYRKEKEYYLFAGSLLQGEKAVRGFYSSNLEELFLFVNTLKGGRFNLIEKILLFRIFETHIPCGLPLADSRKALERYIPLLDLAPEMLALVASDRTAPDLGLRLATLPERDQKAFAGLTERYSLNRNQQKEVFGYLTEISGREKRSLDEIIRKTDSGKDPSDLIEILMAQTMPRYHGTLTEYRKIRNRLDLPPKVNLVETPFFETRSLRAEIFFKSPADAEKRLTLLLTNLKEKRELWEEIFRII